jgi:hypothetical protein
MSAFTFEIVREGEASIVAEVLTLSDDKAIWCYLEALALRFQHSDGAFIRVKNSEGETVVRAGVTTALASIEMCPCKSCLLKRELKRRASTGNHAATHFDLHFSPCGRRGKCSCR